MSGCRQPQGPLPPYKAGGEEPARARPRTRSVGSVCVAPRALVGKGSASRPASTLGVGAEPAAQMTRSASSSCNRGRERRTHRIRGVLQVQTVEKKKQGSKAGQAGAAGGCSSSRRAGELGREQVLPPKRGHHARGNRQGALFLGSHAPPAPAAPTALRRASALPHLRLPLSVGEVDAALR